ncbi:MAG: acyl-CoA carboxylase subunit epsilon [Actinomycetes bacterium]
MSNAKEPNLAAELSVVRGNPSEADLAAVIAVLSQTLEEVNGQVGPVAAQPKSNWSQNAGILRGDLAPGFGQWNAQFRRGL